LQTQVKTTIQAIADLGEPTARMRDICLKVADYNEKMELGYVTKTLANSIRRAIYENLGNDEDGTFVREGKGYYRLSIKVIVNTVVHADAWQFARLMPTESVGCIATDPPWTALDKHRAVGTTTRLMQRDWFSTRDIDKDLLGHMARVLQNGRHMYLFHPALNEDTIKTICQIQGWVKEVGLTFKKALVWDKQSMGMGYCYRYQHEMVFFLAKGKARKLNDLGISDVLPFKRVSQKTQVHDCQKPKELLKLLIRQSTDKGDLVADFFAGSGSTGEACRELGRNYVLVDISLKWVKHMKKSLKPRRVLSLN